MASSISATSTTTAITFAITLSSTFTPENYMEVGVTDKPFTNDSYFLATNSITRCVATNPNYEIETTSVRFTITTWGSISTSIMPNHEYTFYGYAKAHNGKYYQIPAGGSALTVRTQSNTPSVSVPYDLVCIKRRQVSNDFVLDFNITVLNGTDRLIVEMSTSNITNSSGGFVNVTHSFNKALSELTNVSGNTYSFSFSSDLMQLTSYYIHACAVQSGVAGDWCDIECVSTPLKRKWLSYAYIDRGSMNGTYFNCYLKKNEWNDGDNSDSFSYLTFEFFYNGIPVEITHKRVGASVSPLSSSTYKVILTAAEIDSAPSLYTQDNGYASVLPNSNAMITAHVHIYSFINDTYLQPVDENGNDYVGIFTYNYTVAPAIDKFDWTISNGSASAQQTQSAYYAITHNGNVDDFSYYVWNDIVSKINEVVGYTGSLWDTTYATENNTKMSNLDKNLTAVRFNSARYNVDIHHATGITEKSAGQRVYGSYILNLVSKLNEWIDTL